MINKYAIRTMSFEVFFSSLCTIFLICLACVCVTQIYHTGSMLGGNDGDGHYINTVARQCGIRVGDIIVAINGIGYRRFQIDYHVEDDDDDNGVVSTSPPPLGVILTDFKNHSSSSSEAEEEVKVGEREAWVDEEEPEAGEEADEAKVGQALLEEEEDEAFHDAIDADNVDDGNNATHSTNDNNNNNDNNNSTKEVDNNDNIAGHEFAEGSEEEY